MAFPELMGMYLDPVYDVNSHFHFFPPANGTYRKIQNQYTKIAIEWDFEQLNIQIRYNGTIYTKKIIYFKNKKEKRTKERKKKYTKPIIKIITYHSERTTEIKRIKLLEMK